MLRGYNGMVHIPPDQECVVACGTVLLSGQAVTAELDVVVDAGVGG